MGEEWRKLRAGIGVLRADMFASGFEICVAGEHEGAAVERRWGIDWIFICLLSVFMIREHANIQLRTP